MDADDVGDLAAVCRAVRPELPADAVFCHWTAAALRGWWLPTVTPPTLIANTGDPDVHMLRRGLSLRRCGIPARHVQPVDGIRVASAEWTFNELAEHLRLLDLVAVADGALHHGHTTLGQLQAGLVTGRRGVRMARRALQLVDDRSESPYETHLRLLHQFAGIPVDLQVEVNDEFGVLVGRSDLGIRGTRRLVDYDGSGHRSADRHRRDLARDKAYARLGWEHYAYTRPEITTGAARIIRDAEEALGLRHVPGRLSTWRALYAESSLSGWGRAQLEKRLQRFTRPEPPRRRSPST